MKRTRQIIESKQRIYEALINLMNTRPFDEITLTELADEAQVTRMTLYRHFKDKNQILLFGFSQYVALTTQEMAKIGTASLYDLTSFRFKILSESPHTEILAKNRLLDEMFSRFGLYYKDQFRALLPNYENPYVKVFVAGGMDQLTKKWIEDGMLVPHDEMARIVTGIIEQINHITRRNGL